MAQTIWLRNRQQKETSVLLTLFLKLLQSYKDNNKR